MEEHEYAQVLAHDEWVAKVAYPSHIVDHLNKLNKRMEGKNGNILSNVEKIKVSEET
jgi:hypothetical protein